ncbi:transposase [Marinobacterium sp. CAU 1594]|nr:transposase [Marinobacterium arenosum]
MVTTCTRHREPVFQHFFIGRLLVDTLRRQQHRADTWAFVVMPDHLHWLVQLRMGMSLSKLVHNVKGSSARQINQVLRREGPLWQDGFYDRAMRSEADCLHAARYLVANPLRAGLVSSVAEYSLWDAKWL